MKPETATFRVALLAACFAPAAARGQAPVLPPGGGADPGSVRSTLGPIPGAGGNPFGGTPGTDAAFLGGRPGPSFPRVPSSITTPGGPAAAPAQGMAVPTRRKITEVPVYGPLDVPDAAEEEGPPDGLSLDAAVDRLLKENLALQALRWQIPAARADVLTAGLRANPIVYADAQLVPYGGYHRERPGGPTQFDLNINHPVDYSGKRLARLDSARQVVSVQEARFQDAARVQVDNLYTAFVDVLAARETLRFARAGQAGLTRQLEIHRELYRKSDLTRADVRRVEALLEAAGLGVSDSEALLRRTNYSLAALLNLPPGQADSVMVRGTIADPAPPPPPPEVLARIALESRPDLAAQRLGTRRAEADVRLARANRFGDAYVLYQPYTFQNNAPTGNKSATSYALGLTVPIPVYNRNQGGVIRSRLNVEQTRIEASAVGLKVAAEVRDAEREYAVSRALVARIERDLLPAARHLRDDTTQLFLRGELTALDVDNARKDYNHIVRQYRDALIRHRRSMLALNTAVGARILP